MAFHRPTVSIYKFDSKGGSEKVGSAPLPHIFLAPIRTDVVRTTHDRMRLNQRQPYAVKEGAGYGTAAESWGTGRAVSRIPRVPGGGTHRAGQGAFGNMCRGGGMFSPTKTWRKWTRKFTRKSKRLAVAAAVAASAVPSLVMARGHRIDEVPEFPLVLTDGLQSVTKTKVAKEILYSFGMHEDLEKVEKSRDIRPGKGKARGRRHVNRKGPLIIYAEQTGLWFGFRNLLGVDICKVDALNLMQLCPGGYVGRLIVWTESAFKRLNQLYGTFNSPSETCSRTYYLSYPHMVNSDLAAIINSTEIQTAIRPMQQPPSKFKIKKNPLKNWSAMMRLNPAARVLKKRRLIARTPGTDEYAQVQAAKEERRKRKRAEFEKRIALKKAQQEAAA